MNAGFSDIPIAEVESIYYVWWPLATIVMIALMSFLSLLGTILVVFVKRLLVKFDLLQESVQDIRVEGADQKRKLDDHVKNVSVHCNYPVCGKRVSDA